MNVYDFPGKAMGSQDNMLVEHVPGTVVPLEACTFHGTWHCGHMGTKNNGVELRMNQESSKRCYETIEL